MKSAPIQSIDAKKWDSKKGIAKGTGKKENELNHYLDSVKANILKNITL